MERVNIKQLRLFLPPGQDRLIGRLSLERRELFSAIIGDHKTAQVGFELVYAVIMVGFRSGLLNGSVHTLYLAIRLGAIGPCSLMTNPVFLAGPSEAVTPGRALAAPQDGFVINKLTAIICQDRMYFKRAGFDKMLQKRQGMVCAHALEEFRISVF